MDELAPTDINPDMVDGIGGSTEEDQVAIFQIVFSDLVTGFELVA